MLANPAVKLCSLKVQGCSLVVRDLLSRRHLIQGTAANACIDASLLEGKYFLLVEEDCFQSGQSLFYGQIPIHFFLLITSISFLFRTFVASFLHQALNKFPTQVQI